MDTSNRSYKNLFDEFAEDMNRDINDATSDALISQYEISSSTSTDFSNDPVIFDVNNLRSGEQTASQTASYYNRQLRQPFSPLT